MNNENLRIVEISEPNLTYERGNYTFYEYFVRALDNNGEEHHGYLYKSYHVRDSHINHKSFVDKNVTYKWSKPEGWEMNQYKIFSLV